MYPRSMSLPMRGEWIEIGMQVLQFFTLPQSLPMRGEWIEMPYYSILCIKAQSLPMRGEWIEIKLNSQHCYIL